MYRGNQIKRKRAFLITENVDLSEVKQICHFQTLGITNFKMTMQN
jgi:hypothetical protein